MRRFLILCGSLLCLLPVSGQGNHYYLALSGRDEGRGTQSDPWQSLSRLQRQTLRPGDTVSLQGGQVFSGSLHWDSVTGSAKHPVILESAGQEPATIDAGNSDGLVLTHCQYLVIRNLKLHGSGRKSGNQGRGLWAAHCGQLLLRGLEIGGFQHAGLEVQDGTDIRIDSVNAHDNGYAGIAVTGTSFPARTNRQVVISYCTAINNPGDPTELNNHSGNGIVVGLCRNARIEDCVASGNGWDMPRKGNGPVGIWAWESDSVVIQYCVSYRNHTAPGAADGGGFDLDGGVTESLVQYNLSFGNEGYGYGIFQFAGASPWKNNTYRHNISWNDGNVTANGASVLWWNGSGDPTQFSHCYVEHNLLYNDSGYALGVVPGEYASRDFYFLNNTILAKDELMSGGDPDSVHFRGNTWWSVKGGFLFRGDSSFSHWSARHDHTGVNKRPNLKPIAFERYIKPGALRYSHLFKQD